MIFFEPVAVFVGFAFAVADYNRATTSHHLPHGEVVWIDTPVTSTSGQRVLSTSGRVLTTSGGKQYFLSTG